MTVVLVVRAALLFFVNANVLQAHFLQGQWLRVAGSNLVNTKNKINVSGKEKQYPGGRHSVTAWTDAHNKILMYGGENYEKLNELWAFDIKTLSWSFIGPSQNITWPTPCEDCVSCSYGNSAVLYGGLLKRKGKSVFHTWSLNTISKSWSKVLSQSPPPREKSLYWCDRQRGLLWLYGGIQNDKDLIDMWKFSFNTMKWYKINNTSSPKDRYQGTTWITGNTLYLYGGLQASRKLMSDLWSYHPITNQWELIAGSNVTDQPGQYIDKGVPSYIAHPGCRYDTLSWSHDNELWLYGGKGYGSNSSSIGLLSDLWMLNTSTNLWTWVSGKSSTKQKSFYSKKNLNNPKNSPGSRAGSLTFRQADKLWIFGGIGYDTHDILGPLNDIWVFTFQDFGPPSHSHGLPGDTIDMPYSQRLMIAFAVLIIAMILSLLACYRKECNIMYWRYKKKSPHVKYEPLKMQMQVPAV